VHLVEKAAGECGEFAHCRPWDTCIFTSPKTVFGGEVRLPDAVILLHTKVGTKYDDHGIIADAAKVGIPTVAVVDTDCNPNIITYPVPGNDDTIESAELYLRLFKEAIMLGKKYRAEQGNAI
jgi:small subunit ribosomal protein S2